MSLTIAVVFHSRSGHTKKLAHVIADAINEQKNVRADLIEISDDNQGKWSRLFNADAIIFGSPTFMASISASLKCFMDESADFWLKMPLKNKLAAGFTISTSPHGDKYGALMTMITFAMQHGMIWVGHKIYVLYLNLAK